MTQNQRQDLLYFAGQKDESAKRFMRKARWLKAELAKRNPECVPSYFAWGPWYSTDVLMARFCSQEAREFRRLVADNGD